MPQFLDSEHYYEKRYKIRCHTLKQKNPSSYQLLEGLHPVYLTLWYVLPGLCRSQSETIAKYSFLPYFISGQKWTFFKDLRASAIWQGRSSGSPARLATFPSRLVETVVFAAKRVLSLYTTYNKKSGVTAAGPLPALTGFPIKLTHLIPWAYPLRENRSQVNKIQLTKALGSFNWILKI
jgi:hypothetical protein